MCMSIAAESFAAWLETQERMMRAWVAQAALDPAADTRQIARLEAHCRWLARERAEVLGSARRAAA